MFAPFTAAAKEEMLSLFAPWSADECISAFEPEGKKAHQGVAPQNLALHQGIAWSNSTSALGLRTLAVENRVGSRCTGKERDSESGLDNFGARYEASSLGRFMTPDWAAKPISVPYATVGDPQTLNLYTYVENSPLNRIDADGHQQQGVQQNGMISCSDHVICVSDAGGGRLHEVVADLGGVDDAPTEFFDGAGAAAQDKAQAKVQKQKYARATRRTSQGVKKGVRIELAARVRGGDYTHLNWIQKVTTNKPLGNNPANQPYLDRDAGQQTPFYWNPQEQAAHENIVPGPLPSETTFVDQPDRSFSGNAISWHADLSLVGIKSDGTYDTLKSFSYGFTLDASGVHPDQLTGVQ